MCSKLYACTFAHFNYKLKASELTSRMNAMPNDRVEDSIRHSKNKTKRKKTAVARFG